MGIAGWVVTGLCVSVGFWLGSITDYLRNRSYELERQDYSPELGNYTLDEFDDMMSGLADLNRADKGGYQATLRMFQKLDTNPSSVLEIGWCSSFFCYSRSHIRFWSGRFLNSSWNTLSKCFNYWN
jgi:hypothetical protein